MVIARLLLLVDLFIVLGSKGPRTLAIYYAIAIAITIMFKNCEWQSDVGNCPVLMLIHTERKRTFSLVSVVYSLIFSLVL